LSATLTEIPARPARPEQNSRPAMAWMDRIAGSDPGLNQFRMAFQCVLSIAAAIGGGWLFVHFTHALLIETHGAHLSAAQATATAAANHEFVVLGELLAALVAMLSTFGVMETDLRGQVVTSLWAPVPMIGALAFGLWVGAYRVPSLVMLAVVLAVGTYLRRFGPRGFLTGLLLFMGYFLGFFFRVDGIPLSDLGWFSAEIGVGVIVTLIVRIVVFYPHPDKALQRTRRSYAARARKVIRLSLAVFDGEDGAEGRLSRQLVRLNETALMIDAHLGDPNALPGGSAARLHQFLFDSELALTNIARFAQSMVQLDLPGAQRESVRQALAALCQSDLAAAKVAARDLSRQLRAADTDGGRREDRAAVVIPHRFAESVIAFADGLEGWMATVTRRDGEPAEVAFQPTVRLFAGWLPGSAPVSAAASLEAGSHPLDRIRMAPYTRAAIQMGVAVGAAISVGVVISGYRFYWAVIAAFVTMMGTNNRGEQIRKALFRAIGTLVGIAAGSGIVDLVGGHTNYSIAVILVALFIGLYLQRINYTFMVIAVTILVAQLYKQLGEYSNHLLLLRLAETSTGAGLAILTVIVVFPLRTNHVLHVATRGHLQALARLVGHATERLLDHDAHVALRADARAVDLAEQTLITTLQPLRRNLFGGLDHHVAEGLALAGASRNYGRNLVSDLEAMGPLDEETCTDLTRGCGTLNASIDVLVHAVDGPRDGTYTRSAALFDRAERRLDDDATVIAPGVLAIRDLELIDGVMARMAEEMGLTVANYDTATLANLE
jgi:uncharacterized membrane protein YgaE (UPF0421/DUF939 family)